MISAQQTIRRRAFEAPLEWLRRERERGQRHREWQLSPEGRGPQTAYRLGLISNAILVGSIAWVFETEFDLGPLYLIAPTLLVLLAILQLLGGGAIGTASLRYGLSFLLVSSSIAAAVAHGSAPHAAVMLMIFQPLYLLLTMSYGAVAGARLSALAGGVGVALAMGYFVGHPLRLGDAATDLLLITVLYQPPTVCMVYFLAAYREAIAAGLARAGARMAAMQGRLETEQALAEARLELGRIDRSLSLGALSAALVHELNQPFAAITANASAAERWMQRAEPEEARSAIHEAARAAERASAIVGGLRRLIGSDQDQREPVDLNRLIEDTLPLLRGDLEQRHITMELQLGAVAPVTVDATQIQQVLINLVSNAADAVSNQDPPRRITVVTATADGWTLLSVADNGPGLSEAARSQAFDAFFTTKPGGAGLGLAICRLGVEQHGGVLDTRANTPTGAVFTVRLPMEGDLRQLAEEQDAVSSADSVATAAERAGLEPTRSAVGTPILRSIIGWLRREIERARLYMVWQRTPAGRSAGTAYQLNTIFNMILVSAIAGTFEIEFDLGLLYLVTPAVLQFLMTATLLGWVLATRSIGNGLSFLLTSWSLVAAVAYGSAPHAAVMLVSFQGLFLLLIVTSGAVVGSRLSLLAGGVGLVLAMGYFLGRPFRPGEAATDLLIIAALAQPPAICLTYYLAAYREAMGASLARAEASLGAMQDRLETEQALAEARLDLGRIDRSLSLGALSAALAHELNQPLAAITANAAAAERWMQRDEPEEARSAIHEAARAAERASGIVGSLRRLIANDREQSGPVDLNRLVEDTLPLLRDDLERGDVTMELRLGDTAPLQVDATQIQQVLINLVTNAVAALSGQGPPRRTTISTAISKGWVTLSVADNGPGLSEAARSHAFDAFFTTKPGGAGLGLAICRLAVENHGGTLDVGDNSPNGALFIVRLPFYSADSGQHVRRGVTA